MQYLRSESTGREGRLSLPVVRARQVDIHGAGDVHVDDEAGTLYDCRSRSRSNIEVAAVEVLVCQESQSAPLLRRLSNVVG